MRIRDMTPPNNRYRPVLIYVIPIMETETGLLFGFAYVPTINNDLAQDFHYFDAHIRDASPPNK